MADIDSSFGFNSLLKISKLGKLKLSSKGYRAAPILGSEIYCEIKVRFQSSSKGTVLYFSAKDMCNKLLCMNPTKRFTSIKFYSKKICVNYSFDVLIYMLCSSDWGSMFCTDYNPGI